MWHLDHQGATSLEVSKFWVVNRHQTNKHPGCTGHLHVCLHILVWLYNTFKWGAVWNTLCWSQNMLAEHHSLSIQGNSLNVTSTSGFLGRKGSGLKDIWSSCNSPTTKKPKKNPSRGERCDAAPPQVAELRYNNPQRLVKIGNRNMSPQCINLEGYGWRFSTSKRHTSNSTKLWIVRVYCEQKLTQMRQM